MPTSKNPYLTRKETAEYLFVCIITLENRSNRGILKPKGVIGALRVFFHIDELSNALFAVPTHGSRRR